MTRIEAIGRLRYYLKSLIDDEHSMCQVAAKKGIFCHGFSRWSDEELPAHLAHVVKRRPNLNRWQLEELGNRWELARQIVQNVTLACDVQTLEHDTCRGWDDFSNQDLERFCADLLGLDVSVTGSAPQNPSA